MTPPLLRRALELLQQVGCGKPSATELLLAANVLSTQDLLHAVEQGGTYFRISQFTSTANGEAVQILDIETQGRVREVSIWLDSAVGGPDPVIRLSEKASGSVGNGVRMAPGGPNELGKVPPNTTLFLSSDVTINGYVIERG